MSAATRPMSSGSTARLQPIGLGIAAAAGTGILLVAFAGSLGSAATAPAPAPVVHDRGGRADSGATAPVRSLDGSNDRGGTIVVRFPR